VILLWLTPEAAGAAALGAIAPSQPGAAVAGVQLASRQHNDPSPFFQFREPSPLFQLSVAIAAVAETVITEASNSFRVLFIFSPQKSLLIKVKLKCNSPYLDAKDCKATHLNFVLTGRILS
jgi:hypothetical protein